MLTEGKGVCCGGYKGFKRNIGVFFKERVLVAVIAKVAREIPRYTVK